MKLVVDAPACDHPTPRINTVLTNDMESILDTRIYTPTEVLRRPCRVPKLPGSRVVVEILSRLVDERVSGGLL
ncbi:hypothetical protein, partial [Mycolicibacterium mageritense]|uniref:hypothetical protein n=1 Tax=Mycolicibacterium mageritense TaxID=53462 RepID=UPI003B0022CE